MEKTALFFMTPCRPDLSTPGSVKLIDKSNAFTLFFLYPEKLFDLSMETIPIEDRRLLPVWGEEIYRLKFKVINPKKKGKLRYSIEALK